MKRSIRRMIPAALCVLLCIVSVVSVCAAGGDPVDPVWDGMVARWKPPARETSLYMIELFLGGNYLSDYSTTGTFYDFSDTIKNAGPGDYTFHVMAVFDDTSKSNIVNSDTYTYKGSGHAHSLDHVGFQYATCTEKGVKEHYECPVCGSYFWDAGGENEIADKNEVVLPANGHSWGAWQVTKTPTATAQGEQRRVCSECGKTETKALPKTAAPTQATTVPKTTHPASTAATKATQPSTAVAKTTAATKPTQPSSGRTQPTTDAAAVTYGTRPAATTAPNNSGVPVDPTGIFGLPLGWSISVIILAALFLVVLPAILIPVIIYSKKKQNRQNQQHQQTFYSDDQR